MNFASLGNCFSYEQECAGFIDECAGRRYRKATEGSKYLYKERVKYFKIKYANK